jgi:hypothetical protein
LAWLAGKLTYSNVVSTLCLFVLLGGGAYAATKLPKNSVGARQLKKNSVTKAKIRANAVTGAEVADGSLSGADIAASTLGVVPRAEAASSAGTAVNAARADFADGAAVAAAATTAADAQKLDGRGLSDFRDRCWFTEQVGWDVCVTGEDVATDQEWEGAVETCADQGRRLPDISEGYAMANYGQALGLPEEELYWTDHFWTDEGEPRAFAVSGTQAGGADLEIQDATAELRVRCVGVPTNGPGLTPEPQPAQ